MSLIFSFLVIIAPFSVAPVSLKTSWTISHSWGANVPFQKNALRYMRDTAYVFGDALTQMCRFISCLGKDLFVLRFE